MTRPVLLVIDMMNDALRRWSASSRFELIAATNELVHIMRAASSPVIWVRQEFEPDLSDALLEMRSHHLHFMIKGTTGAELVCGLDMQDSDIVLIKKRYSAFFGTGLDEILAGMQADTILLAGVNTHACIRTTAIDAYQRDLHVVLASDCVDSYDREHHDVSLRYMKDKIARVLSNQQIAHELHVGTIRDVPSSD